jgi:hypothetical protein
MKLAVEQIFNGSLDQVAVGGAYDATKINRGKHGGQYDLGAGALDKFIGPCPLGVANFAESPLAIPSQFVHPVKITDNLFWIFGSDAATAAATRRVQLWTFTPSTNTYVLQGAITCTFPTATNHTVRGIRASLYNYTTGTVGVSGTAVTGTGSAWNVGLSVGSRIGFGSTDPNDIVTWYQISAIGSATGITLTSSAGTITAGTLYVIQDLMLVQATTNATATNGGVFVTKGLQFADFNSPATAIPAATTVDKIKATYWIKDAATITNDVIGGCALGDLTSLTEQFIYCTEGAATSLVIYKYNIRAALTPTAGAFVLTGANLIITGAQTVTGNISQNNNGREAILNHGPGAGVSCIYALTTTRILRIPLSSIVNGSTTFVADSMSEVPPGGANTSIVTGGFVAMDISQVLDKLIIVGNTSTGTVYITDYYTGGQQLDRRSGCLTAQLPSANRDTDSPIFVHSVTSSIPFLWAEDGWLFWVFAQAVTTTINAMVAYPLAADLEFEAEVTNRIICPKINLGAVPGKLYRAVVNSMTNIGDNTMGVSPDMYLLEVRTSGIDDNSGSWTAVPQNGDLSGLGVPVSIQFAFRFRTAGVIMLPNRIFSLALLYESNDALPFMYRWNYADFDTSDGTFAWVQSQLYGGALPVHTITIYRADTNIGVLSQSSSGSVNGTFEYWDGAAWVAGIGADTVGRRRRFVPTASLPGSIDLYAIITLA